MAKAVGRDRGIWGNDLIRPARAEWKLSERSGAGGEVRGRRLERERPRDPRCGANEWTGQAVSEAEPLREAWEDLSVDWSGGWSLGSRLDRASQDARQGLRSARVGSGWCGIGLSQSGCGGGLCFGPWAIASPKLGAGSVCPSKVRLAKPWSRGGSARALRR